VRRKGLLPPQQDQEIFSLQAGGVSKVETEPVGFVIYRVESKETVPLEKVKDEITRDIFRQKMEKDTQAAKAGVHVDLDEAYFGPAAAPPPAMPGSQLSAPSSSRPAPPPVPKPAPSAQHPPK